MVRPAIGVMIAGPRAIGPAALSKAELLQLRPLKGLKRPFFRLNSSAFCSVFMTRGGWECGSLSKRREKSSQFFIFLMVLT
jgi:hypothetical protein